MQGRPRAGCGDELGGRGLELGTHLFVAAALQRDAAAHPAKLLGLHLRLGGAAATFLLFLERISVVVHHGGVVDRIRAAQVADGRDEAAYRKRDICLDRVLTGVDVAALRVNALWVEGRKHKLSLTVLALARDTGFPNTRAKFLPR